MMKHLLIIIQMICGAVGLVAALGLCTLGWSCLQTWMTEVDQAAVSAETQLSLLNEVFRDTGEVVAESTKVIALYEGDVIRTRKIADDAGTCLESWAEHADQGAVVCTKLRELCGTLSNQLPIKVPSGVDVEWKRADLKVMTVPYPCDATVTKTSFFCDEKQQLDTIGAKLQESVTTMSRTGRLMKDTADLLQTDTVKSLDQTLAGLRLTRGKLETLSSETLPRCIQKLETQRQAVQKSRARLKFVPAVFACFCVLAIVLPIVVLVNGLTLMRIP